MKEEKYYYKILFNMFLIEICLFGIAAGVSYKNPLIMAMANIAIFIFTLFIAWQGYQLGWDLRREHEIESAKEWIKKEI